jgi:hypothetical protein
VTMNNNTISDACSAGGTLNSGFGDYGSQGFSNYGPEPGTISLLSVGLLALAFRGLRSRTIPSGRSFASAAKSAPVPVLGAVLDA